MSFILAPRAVALITALGFAIMPSVASDGASTDIDTRAQDPPAARRVVRISAERFLFTPSAITVEEGTQLEIRLTSDDTDHGFRIVGSSINVSIPKRNRGEAVAIFAATEPGDYTFECSHMCGAGHGFMRGRIRVKARASDAAKTPGGRR